MCIKMENKTLRESWCCIMLDHIYIYHVMGDFVVHSFDLWVVLEFEFDWKQKKIIKKEERKNKIKGKAPLLLPVLSPGPAPVCPAPGLLAQLPASCSRPSASRIPTQPHLGQRHVPPGPVRARRSPPNHRLMLWPLTARRFFPCNCYLHFIHAYACPLAQCVHGATRPTIA